MEEHLRNRGILVNLQCKDISNLMGGTLKILLGVFLRSRETVKIYGYRAAARIISAQPPPNKFEGATHYCISLLEWVPAQGIPVNL